MDELYREASGGGPAVAARQHENTLFGFTGAKLRLTGAVLIVVGLLLVVAASYLWTSYGASTVASGSLQSIAQNAATAYATSLLLTMVGSVLALVGLTALVLGLLRPVATFVARETSPAVGTVTHSAAVAALDRRKCRSCGRLNPDDAVYCCTCGRSL